MRRLALARVLWTIVIVAGCQRQPAAPAGSPSPPASPAPDVLAVSRHGAPLSGLTTVTLEALLANPQPYVGKAVALEGPVRQACTRKGCWMELASTPNGPGVRVRFKDYGFFVPTDAAGSTARVEGEVSVAVLSEGRAAHWASEGAQIPRGSDGIAREVQLVATGVELRQPKR